MSHFSPRKVYFQRRAYISGNRVVSEFPVNRVFSEGTFTPSEGLPGTLPREFFFLATGIWPLNAIKPPRHRGRPYVLREIAECDTHSVVRPNLEDVDGRWCHVLEDPDVDSLWLDVERECALVARETRDPENRALVQRIELRRHVEVSPQIWMPTSIRNI